MTLNCKGSDIKYFGGYVCVPCQSPGDTLGELVADKEYTVTVKRKTKKRSLDANAYYWELCGKLAQHMGVTSGEVYRRHIVDMSNYETYCMMSPAVEAFSRLWCSDHYGRSIDTRESKIPGCTTVLAYYGSSDFDTAQMSRLIDNCVQDCKALGIETRPEEEVRSLLAQWKEEKNAAGSADGQTSGSTGTTYSEGR